MAADLEEVDREDCTELISLLDEAGGQLEDDYIGIECHEETERRAANTLWAV